MHEQPGVDTLRGIQLRSFAGASAATCVSTSTQWMQPMLLSYLVIQKGMNPAVAGFLLTVELAGTAMSAVLAARFVPRQHARALALLGISVAVLASFATLYLQSYGALLAARVTAGFGVGAPIQVSNMLVARFTDPDKAFARIGGVNLLFGSLLVASIPYVASVLPRSAPFATLLMALLVLILPLALIPKVAYQSDVADSEQLGSPAVQRGGGPLGLHASLLMLVTFAIVVSSGVLWSLYGVIGEHASLSAEMINAAISMSIFTGFIGVLLPAIIGSSFGRVAPLSIALLLMAGAIVVLTSQPSGLEFRVAVCVNVAMIYFIMPYLTGAAIALDRGGKIASYVNSTFFFASALTPLTAGILLRSVGIELFGRLVVLVSLVSISIFVYVDRRAGHKQISPTGAASI